MSNNNSNVTTATETSTKRAAKGPALKMAQIAEILARRPEGVTLERKKNWLKVQGKNGAVMYISLKDDVRQIDLSGWGEGVEGTHPPKKPNGNVQAQVDLGRPDAIALLEQLLAQLADAVPHRKGRKGNKAGKDSRAAALQALAVLGIGGTMPAEQASQADSDDSDDGHEAPADDSADADEDESDDEVIGDENTMDVHQK